MKKVLDIKQLFESNKGVLTTSELQDFGVNYYYIKKLMQAGKVERIKPGFYRWVEFGGDELFEALKIVPNGIACLYTAAAYHELTTFVSSWYHIAIPNKSKVKLPDYPPIKLYYWSKSLYNLRQGEVETETGEFPFIYNKEKTVCDFVKFRNKVGVDLTKEVLKNYLNTEGRNISLLISYSKELNIHSIMKSYLEVLL